MVVAGCKLPDRTLLELLLDVRKAEVTMGREKEKMKEGIRKTKVSRKGRKERRRKEYKKKSHRKKRVTK
jgi:hypothetical protein